MNTKLLKNKHLKEFLRESGIHGLRLLLYYVPFKYARLIWSIFMVAVIIWTHIIIATLTIKYTQQPTEVHMSTDQVHVSNTPFPGVAFCSASKFSRTKVLEFAEEVFRKQQIYKPYYMAQTVEEMGRHLLNLKAFYLFPYDSEPLNLPLIRRMHKLFTFMFNTTNYPIRDYMRDLAPDCEDLIARGTIYSAKINIADYFSKRMTSSSVCCMFNYNRKSYSIDLQQRVVDDNFTNKAGEIKFESSSLLNSIQFVLRHDVEDFTVTEFQNTAFQLYIFPREDYPTIQSNRIGEILIDYSTIVEVPIEPEFFGSSQQVRQFAPHLRNCYYPDEGQKLLNQSFYSMDECLLLCRIDSMMKYCGCVTPPMAATDKNFKYCNFLDLPCLRKWKDVWYGWDYFEYVHENNTDLKVDLTSGRRCPNCLPSCNGVDFNLEENVRVLRPTLESNYVHGILKGMNSSTPLSVVRIFFKQDNLLYTEMDIVGDWVVLLNRFGGIMSLMYGFSIVSYIEILYFATGKFFAFYFESWTLKLDRKISVRAHPPHKNAQVADYNNSLPSYDLYWQELKPQRAIDMEIFKYNVAMLYKRDEN